MIRTNNNASLDLQVAQFDLVVQGEEGQYTLGLDQLEDVEVAAHVGPLRHKNTVDQLEAVCPSERDRSLALPISILHIEMLKLWSVANILPGVYTSGGSSIDEKGKEGCT